MNRKFSLVLAGLLAVVLGVAATLSISAIENRSAFVASGQGATALVEDARLTGYETLRMVAGPLALRTDSSANPQHSLIVIVAPQSSYDAEEIEFVRAFLEAGGHVLVADAYGQANSLTTALGVTFERVRLVEPDSSRTVPVLLVGQTLQLRVLEPTALRLAPALSATILGESSPDSFIDRDGNGAINDADPRGPFPLLVEVPVGENGGTLIALSDPTALSSAAADAADNRIWRQRLLGHMLPDGGRVLFDESRTASADPVVSVTAMVVGAASSEPWRYVLAGVGAMAILAILLPLVDEKWGPHRFQPHHFIRRAFVRAGPTTGRAVPPKSPTAEGPASRWTPRGMAAIFAMSGLATVGLALGNRQATYGAAFLLVALVAALLPSRGELTAKRSLSADLVREGTPVQVRLRLQSASRRRIHVELSDLLPREFDVNGGTNWQRVDLGRGAATALAYSTIPAVRGPYTIGPLRARSSDVFRLRIRERCLDDGAQMRVTPRQESVRKTPFSTRTPSVTMGPHLVNRAGDGTEFHSLRDYQTGDSIRSINWKASARSKDFVVNQRVHESLTRLNIFIDARAISGAGPASSTALAHSARAAASIATGALQVRDRVRVFIYGDGVHEVPAASGMRQLHELDKVLCDVTPTGAMTFMEAVEEVLATLKSHTPVMLISGLEDDPSIVEAMTRLRGREMQPVVVASPLRLDPIDPTDGGPEPGAKDILGKRAAVVTALRGAGVSVYDAVEGIPLDHLFRLGGAR